MKRVTVFVDGFNLHHTIDDLPASVLERPGGAMRATACP